MEQSQSPPQSQLTIDALRRSVSAGTGLSEAQALALIYLAESAVALVRAEADMSRLTMPPEPCQLKQCVLAYEGALHGIRRGAFALIPVEEQALLNLGRPSIEEMVARVQAGGGLTHVEAMRILDHQEQQLALPL